MDNNFDLFLPLLVFDCGDTRGVVPYQSCIGVLVGVILGAVIEGDRRLYFDRFTCNCSSD